jgi:hypothetical protein
LARIDAFLLANEHFPPPSALCDRKEMKGSVQRNLTRLEEAGFIKRATPPHWDSAERLAKDLPSPVLLKQVARAHIPAKERPVVKEKPAAKAAPAPEASLRQRTSQRTKRQASNARTQRAVYQVGNQTMRLSRKGQAALYYIAESVRLYNIFPSTTYVGEKIHGKTLTSFDRAHMIQTYANLEAQGIVARSKSGNGASWGKYGRLTPFGEAVARKLSPDVLKDVLRPVTRVGGGIDIDGGTRFKDKLFSVDTLRRKGITQRGDAHSKIGHVAKKAADGGRQKGLPIATFSLEEGRTCSPTCGMRERCYAGKMALQRRILYEGEKTDRAVAHAIVTAGPMHWRINTVGDIPRPEFLEAVLSALTVAGSTAWGYTHWQPEHPLGEQIRMYSEYYWNFFAIRTSYEHGSRDPLPERGAVVMEKFHPELLELHNAIACPEQTGEARNCGECGLCWTVRRNIAFEDH